MTAWLAAGSLAVWLYLLLGRGGFWLARIEPAARDDSSPACGEGQGGGSRSHLRRRRSSTSPASGGGTTRSSCPRVAAIIPARDEAEVIGRAVRSLLEQDYAGALEVIVVDDHSSDGTAEMAREAAASLVAEHRLRIVAARKLPPGWTGKLWAQSEGLAALRGGIDYVLLTDADIAHDQGSVAELVARAEAGELDLVSLMVRLNNRSVVERALIPAFVFFFAKLYPFSWARDPRRGTAAAAGGCMLVRWRALDRIGGFGRIRGALIDDCALAREIKKSGRIWLGFTQRTHSLRLYPRLGDIWRMVARTAYTQLDYSPALLGATVLGMVVTYLVPPLLVWELGLAGWLSFVAWLLMSVAYLPMLRLYGQSPLWAPLLPVIALFYLGATLDSARRHFLGKGGEWKGRVHSRQGA